MVCKTLDIRAWKTVTPEIWKAKKPSLSVSVYCFEFPGHSAGSWGPLKSQTHALKWWEELFFREGMQVEFTMQKTRQEREVRMNAAPPNLTTNVTIYMTLNFPFGEGNGTTLQYSCLENPIEDSEEPGGLQSMGSQRVGQNWATNTLTFTIVDVQYKLQVNNIVTHSS